MRQHYILLSAIFLACCCHIATQTPRFFQSPDLSRCASSRRHLAVFFFFLCYFQRTHLPRDSLSFLNLLDLNAWLPGSQPQPTNHHRSHYQSVYFSIYSLDTVQSSRILTFFFTLNIESVHNINAVVDLIKVHRENVMGSLNLALEYY